MGKGFGGHSSHTDGILAPDTCQSGKSAMHALAVALFFGHCGAASCVNFGFLGSDGTMLAGQTPGVRCKLDMWPQGPRGTIAELPILLSSRVLARPTSREVWGVIHRWNQRGMARLKSH